MNLSFFQCLCGYISFVELLRNGYGVVVYECDFFVLESTNIFYICDLFSANSSSAPELMWQSLLGAALSSCHKLPRRINHNDIEEALSMAKDYKSCVQVLTPVADFLDSMHR